MKMQEMVSCCVKMYEAAGGKVQKDKVFVCCWKWKDNQKMNVNRDTKLNENVTKQTMANESVKTLGVCVNP